jgi:tetratricopeptide (TPR) repeat protein
MILKDGAMLGRTLISVALLLARAGAALGAGADPVGAAIDRCLAHQGDAGAVVRACDAAIASNQLTASGGALARVSRGIALRATGQPGRAIEDFATAIALDPKLPPAYLARADALVAERRHARAIADLDSALRLDPKLSAGYFLRGTAKDNLGRHDDAIADYSEAIRLAPEARYYLERGNAYLGKNDFAHAIADYDAAARRAPKDPAAYYQRGIANFDRGDFPAAAADLERAVALEPDQAYAVIWLYLARARGGQDARAALSRDADRLDFALWPTPLVRLYLGEIGPGDVKPPQGPAPWLTQGNLCEAQFYLGQYYVLRGMRDAAARAFRAALATGIREYAEYRQAEIALGQLGR